MREPLPHQPAAIAATVDQPCWMLLLDKRLGKCLVGIRWALRQAPGGRVLVAAPKSACPGWLDELAVDGQMGVLLADMSEKERLEAIVAFDNHRLSKPGRTGFFVVNPQALMLPMMRGAAVPEGKKKMVRPSKLAMLGWDAVIWDESTNIKNPASQINKLAQSHIARIPRRLALTGEIAPEGPQDIFEQAKFVHGQFMGHTNMYKWLDAHFNKVDYSWCPKLQSLQKIKEALAACSFRMTRREAGIGETKTFENRYAYLPDRLRKIYDEAQEHFELPAAPRTTVVHVDDPQGYDVYIGRANRHRGLEGSPFANPFSIGKLTREEVLTHYREYITKRPDLIEQARRTLRGKRLGCWCKPEGCHGDVLVELIENEDGGTAENEAKYILQIANWCSQIAGGYPWERPDLHSPHKMEVLKELLTGEYAKESVVITFRYNSELAAAVDMAKKAKMTHAFIVGETPVEDRRRIGHHFQERKFSKLFMQVKVARFGIDLSAADTMIRYSLPYSYEDVSQSMDRIVHPKKKMPLHYIDIITKDTVDEDVAALAKEKALDARFFMTKLKGRLSDRLGGKK